MPRTFASEYDGEDARRARVRSLMRLSPASRHRSFMEDYDRFHRGPDASRERARVLHRPLTTDAHVVRDTFRFLRDDEEDAALGAWESRVTLANPGAHVAFFVRARPVERSQNVPGH